MRTVLIVLCLLPGCATVQIVRRPNAPEDRVDAVVFVADGAGNFQGCSLMLRDTTQNDRLPVRIQTFEWSHGYCRILADQLSHHHAKRAGKALAREVEDYHARHPRCRIYLLGHSAGATVVLAALEECPLGIVDRAFLLSPSVSAAYDLVPALTNVRHAVHVYTSKHDWWYLGLATHIFGTQDRRYLTPASGRHGFRFVPATPEQESLRSKLKQHPWRQRDAATGNLGGHFGAYQPEYLRRNVLPLVMDEQMPVDPTATAPELIQTNGPLVPTNE